MLERSGLEVSLVKGAEGGTFRTAGVQGQSQHEYVQVEHDNNIAIKLCITRDYDWKDGNFLMVQAWLNSHQPLSSAGIDKPQGRGDFETVIDTFFAWKPEDSR